MGKRKKNLNPADAFRKKQRKKELKRGSSQGAWPSVTNAQCLLVARHQCANALNADRRPWPASFATPDTGYTFHACPEDNHASTRSKEKRQAQRDQRLKLMTPQRIQNEIKKVQRMENEE
eukprot:289304-Amorphochlora_amoeboformis.AAC.1